MRFFSALFFIAQIIFKSGIRNIEIVLKAISKKCKFAKKPYQKYWHNIFLDEIWVLECIIPLLEYFCESEKVFKLYYGDTGILILIWNYNFYFSNNIKSMSLSVFYNN